MNCFHFHVCRYGYTPLPFRIDQKVLNVRMGELQGGSYSGWGKLIEVMDATQRNIEGLFHNLTNARYFH